jgi:aminocarboxymuconate-semialdehyde decarboxylase
LKLGPATQMQLDVIYTELGTPLSGGNMISRRTFLNSAGYAAAGLTLSGRSTALYAQDRKEVFIGGERVKVIDIHAHCLFQEVAPIIAGTSMEGADLTDFLTLKPLRIEQMDARGIDIAALSVNRFWWYAADEDKAEQIVKINDEGLADWCARYPDRFVALSSPALQHPELAAEQLEYAVNELDHRGASIGGHVQGQVPTDRKYDPFWAKAEELGVPIFIHPDNGTNVVHPGSLGNVGGLPNIIGNPLETTVILTRLILEGTLDRFPNLKICAAHGGGYLPSYLGRTEYACQRGGANCANTKLPSEYLKDQITIDTMVFSEEGLRHLVAEVGVSQIVYGTDMPFGWPETLDIIVNAPFLTDAEKIDILSGNLMQMLNIEA